MKWHVLYAVFARNFAAYFWNPTGYVFICVFVLLGSLAAFWPPEFFNSNLANLDQLNRYLPYILLVFIPAITMSSWADERRHGTDELLLTIPASDWEVVLGKYLAAVGIYTVALLFSGICSYVILFVWGGPDLGLFLTNYLGYWFVGLAMLAIGMVASFLTSNLTVAFVLGVLFNAPLALPVLSGTTWGPLFLLRSAVALIPRIGDRLANRSGWETLARRSGWWSIPEQFADFGRGVVSLPAAAYFLGIVAICLYLAVVLIGRRHWAGRANAGVAGLNYFLRLLGLVAAASGSVLLFQAADQWVGLRADLTAERINSLSGETRKLLAGMDWDKPLEIKAFVSPTVPEDYAQTKNNLLATLRQFERLGRGWVRVEIVSTEPNTEAAALASQQFGIEPQTVLARERGAYREEQIVLGCAFTSGLEKVVVPFFDRGTPVEYELIRSVCTVAQRKEATRRKRLGLVTTDADLQGGIDMMTGRPRPTQPLLDELEKQYEVVPVDASLPIPDSFDVLLAVQPSTLGPEQMVNFVAAVAAGVPTAIFEDPLPVMPDWEGLPGTSQPRRSPMGPMAMFGPQGQPKGDIGLLWRTLGVRLAAQPARADGRGEIPYIVCQDHNPHHNKLDLPAEFVFIDTGLGAGSGPSSAPGFSQDQAVTSRLQEMVFPFPGGLVPAEGGEGTFVELVRTAADRTGTIEYERAANNRADRLRIFERPADKAFPLAALVVRRAAAPADGAQPGGDAAPSAATSPPAEKPIRAVVVADVDVLSGVFFGLRNRRDESFNFDFDNVTFALNVLDSLSGDERFIDIRKRRPRHRTLVRIENAVADARDEADAKMAEFITAFEKAEGEATAAMEKEITEHEEKMRELEARGEADPQATMQASQQQATRVMLARRRLATKRETLERQRDAEIAKVERSLESLIRKEQDRQKWMAVLLPPIPPLIVAFFVFFFRRAQEQEGVSRARLR